MNEVAFLFWTQLWQVTVVAMVVFTASKALASDRPHLAHALWVLVLLKCITPPVFSSQLSAFSWMTAEPVAVNALAEGSPVPTALGFDGDLLIPSPVVVEAPGFGASANAGFQSENRTAQVRTAAVSSNVVDWKAIVVTLWLLGSVICLALQIARLAKFVFRIRKSKTIHSKSLESLVARLTTKLGLRQHVRLLVTESLVSPAVIGLLRPTVLVPATVVEQPAKQLESLIAHELIHIRRGDLWWALLQTIAGSAFWFHPLIRFAVTAVTRESERSCDEETIASLGCDPVDYARSLLQILEQKQKLVVAPAVPGVKPIEVTSARLERVMKLGHGSQKRTPWWTWMVLIACSAIVLPGAGLLLAQESDQPDKVTDPRDLPGLVLVVESYKVADIIEQLKKKHPDANVKAVEAMLKRHIDAYLSTMFSEDLKALRKTQLYEGSLIASLPQEEHEQLQKYLPKVREYGLQQIVVEARLLRGENVDLGGSIKWQQQETASFHGKKGTLARKSHQQEVVQAAFEPDIAKGPIDEVDVASLIDANTSGDSQHELRDAKTTHQSVQQAVISDSQLRALLKSQKDNLIESPTVVMLDEHKATIKDCLRRPFVTSTIPKQSESGAIAHQPVISVVPGGAEMHVSAEINGVETVQLSGDFVASKVQEVNTFTFEDNSPQGKGDVTIQLPVLAVAQLKFDSPVKSGQTLCLRAKDPDNAEMVLLLTPRVFDEELEPPKPFAGLEIENTKFYSSTSRKLVDEKSVITEVAVSDDEGQVLPLYAYYKEEDRVRLFNAGPDTLARFEATCKRHGVMVTPDELNREIESRADQIGVSAKRFLQLASEKSDFTEAKLREFWQANLCIDKLRMEGEHRYGKTTAFPEPIVVRSRDKASDWPIDKFEYFEGETFELIQKTDAKVTVEEDATYFQGSNLMLVAGDDLLAVADELELGVAVGSFALELKGNAELDICGLMKADSIRLEGEEPKITMKGNVVIETATATVTADQASFHIEDAMVLEGNAKILFKGSKQPNIVGDKMEIRSDDTVVVDGNELGVKLEF